MATVAEYDKAKLKEIADTILRLKERQQYFHLEDFKPYAKQQEFFDASIFRERMLCAGNQLGKSEAGAYEMACHLTGIYPDDWFGRKFDRAIVAWAAGESSTVARDVQQVKLFGPFGVAELLGTGLVPKDKIVGSPSMARGVTDAFDTVHVRHISGGISSITFKSYEQGRKKFQGTPVDVIWLDEEPDMEIYNECYARGNAVGGLMYTTFTPLSGKTELVNRFFRNDQPKYRKLIRMRIKDCPHMTPDRIEENLAGTPAYQREARMNGEPLQGSGLIFSKPRDDIKEPTMSFIPEEWTKLWSIDFGSTEDHKFAAVLSAWDRDYDTIHILDAYKMAGGPLQNAVRMKNVGIMVPVAWPHDGWRTGVDMANIGASLADMYRKEKLRMLPTHAQFADGGYSTEAGVLEMEQRFCTGRLKVAAHLEEWFDEYQDYHRKDGLIVKKNDDLMSATRIGIVAKRFGQHVPLGSKRPDPRNNPNASIALGGGDDYPLF